jgi:hypothetical protein
MELAKTIYESNPAYMAQVKQSFRRTNAPKTPIQPKNLVASITNVKTANELKETILKTKKATKCLK